MNDQAEGLGFWVERPWARAALSGVLTILVVVVVGWNLPRSVFGYEIRDDARQSLGPIVRRLAMDQGWEVFAPNPSTISIAVVADVTFEDGTTTRFEFPDGEPFVGAFREYRWRKWERRIRQEKNSGLWRGTADWIARELADPDNAVVEVQLVRRWSYTPDPNGDEDRVWSSVDFGRTFTYEDPP